MIRIALCDKCSRIDEKIRFETNFYFFRIDKEGEKMIRQEEHEFMLEFQTSSLHRFREIERFAELDKKLRKCQSPADIPLSF